MELNNIFGSLLVAVGVDVHARAGRVWKVGSPPGSDGEAAANNWTGWSHMILITCLAGWTCNITLSILASAQMDLFKQFTYLPYPLSARLSPE
jgi:hypothetical protein